jgi:hypothetical protein
VLVRRLLPLVVALALSSLGAAAAAPAQLGAGATRITGDSPFPRCSARDRGAQLGAETEPHLAVAPDGTLLAAWHQDRRTTGGSMALGVARSTDGGRRWQRVRVPGVTVCPVQGGEATSDPWLSVGGDGTAYLASLPGRRRGRLETSVVVNRSTDGGRTWSEPVTVSADRRGNDKETLTAHPRRAGVAYVVWTRDVTGAMFSRTTDGGATWSPQRAVPDGDTLIDVRLTVLRDDTLVLTAISETFRRDVVALRSRDDGATWSAPVRVARTDRREPDDADNPRRLLRTSLLHSPALAANGRLHVAFPVGVGSRGGVYLSSSADGSAWSAARRVVRRAAVIPVLAAHPDGRLAMSWYDVSRNRRRARGLPARFATAVSANGGRRWRSRRRRYAFDFLRAPVADRAAFLGDYTGLVARGRGFVAAPALPRPFARAGRSDVVALRFR